MVSIEKLFREIFVHSWPGITTFFEIVLALIGTATVIIGILIGTFRFLRVVVLVWIPGALDWVKSKPSAILEWIRDRVSREREQGKLQKKHRKLIDAFNRSIRFSNIQRDETISNLTISSLACFASFSTLNLLTLATNNIAIRTVYHLIQFEVIRKNPNSNTQLQGGGIGIFVFLFGFVIVFLFSFSTAIDQAQSLSPRWRMYISKTYLKSLRKYEAKKKLEPYVLDSPFWIQVDNARIWKERISLFFKE